VQKNVCVFVAGVDLVDTEKRVVEGFATMGLGMGSAVN
jgi:hypothetical protein